MLPALIIPDNIELLNALECSKKNSISLVNAFDFNEFIIVSENNLSFLVLSSVDASGVVGATPDVAVTVQGNGVYPTGTIQNEITRKTITYDQMEEQELL